MLEAAGWQLIIHGKDRSGRGAEFPQIHSAVGLDLDPVCAVSEQEGQQRLALEGQEKSARGRLEFEQARNRAMIESEQARHQMGLKSAESEQTRRLAADEAQRKAADAAANKIESAGRVAAVTGRENPQPSDIIEGAAGGLIPL